jgi:hypothetical protein
MIDGPVDLKDFNDSLYEYGYHREHHRYYEDRKYLVKETAVYYVDQEFPRITREMITLPARVLSLRYYIDLNGLAGVEPSALLSYGI